MSASDSQLDPDSITHLYLSIREKKKSNMSGTGNLPSSASTSDSEDLSYSWDSIPSSATNTPPPEQSQLSQAIDLITTSVGASAEVSEKPLVAVIGVGYVGLHLVTAFAPHYDVVAFDVSESRIEGLSSELKALTSVRWTAKPDCLAEATHIMIAVPTSLRPNKTINTTYLEEAIKTIASYSKAGATIIVESSVGVGMTRNMLSPLMKARGLKAGMSPERVDPGRTEPPIEDIPKIISGLDDVTAGSLDSIRELYSKVFRNVVTVSKPEVAEMMKLYENCQRMVCIAYTNEMADACRKHGIDPYEVCRAAGTKPFGYLPFTPSVGVGGPCIPVNPYYLLSNSEFPLLQAATEKMQRRPAELGNRAMARMLQRGSVKGRFAKRLPRVLVVGAGFKRGQSLTTLSPAVELMNSLVSSWDVHVSFADPLVPQSVVPAIPRLADCDWTVAGLEWFDLVIVAVRQVGLDFTLLEKATGVDIEDWTQ